MKLINSYLKRNGKKEYDTILFSLERDNIHFINKIK